MPLESGDSTPLQVERINSDGTLDTSFGRNGVASAVLFGFDINSVGMAISATGAIYAGASGDYLSDPDNLPTPAGGASGIVRFTSSGQVDTSFAHNGRTGDSYDAQAGIYNAVAIQPDGKIVAVGQSDSIGGGNQDMLVSRFLPNGTLDPTFGNGGNVLIDFFGSNDLANNVAIAPDGTIVVAGVAENTVGTVGNSTGAYIATARLTSSGALDTTYGGDGKVAEIVLFGEAEARVTGMVVQSDGKIVVAMDAFLATEAAVIRYNTDGTRDASFTSNGMFTFTSNAAGNPAQIGH